MQKGFLTLSEPFDSFGYTQDKFTQGESKGFAQVYLVIGLIVLALLGGAYYFGKLPAKPFIPQPQVSISPSPESTQIDETADWKTYTNKDYGYSIKYPAGVAQETKQIKSSSSQIYNTAHDYFKVDDGILEIYGVCGRGTQAIKTVEIIIDNQKTIKLYETSTRGVISAIKRPNSNESICFNFKLPNDSDTAKSVDNLFDRILSTFKFVNQSTSIPSLTVIPSVQPKKLNYQLPAGWKTVQDTTGTFEVGYDSQVNELSSVSVKPLAVSLAPVWQVSPAKRLGPPVDVALLPYNNGPKHQFILGSRSGWEKGKNYHEREYSYNGWSCLVLFDLFISQGPVTNGVCAVSNDRAFSFGIDSVDEAKAEQLISTLKLLK